MDWGWRICEHVFLLAVGYNDNVAPLVPFPIRPVHGAELPVSISRSMSLAERMDAAMPKEKNHLRGCGSGCDCGCFWPLALSRS